MEPSTRRSLAVPALGLLLFLVLFLPPKLWRASSEASVWIDEVHSIVLSARPVPEIVHLLSGDAHPPLYFLSLKAWLRLGREIGETGGSDGWRPGVLWARSLNVLAWLLTAGIAWWLGRRSLGRGAGGLVAAAIAGGAAAATVVQDLRPYAFAWGALVVAYLLLVDLLELRGSGRPESPDRSDRRAGPRSLSGWLTEPPGRWALVAVAGAIALWSHLLAGVVLAALVTTWLLLISSRTLLRTPPRSLHRRDARPVVACLAATAGAALLAAPWLVRVPGQWEGLRESAPTWMTPATPTALLQTFVYWLPFGRLGSPDQAPFSIVQILGLATILLPVAGTVALSLREGRAGLGDGDATGRIVKLRGAAALGLGASILSVLILWVTARTGLAPVFHGPRYPLLAAGPWAGGLAALAALATSAGFGRANRRLPWLGWLLMAPWLLAGLVAPLWSGALEDRGGLPGALGGQELREVHVLPPELMPIFRHTLAGVTVHPIGDLPCDLLGLHPGDSATVLDLNPWHGVDRGSDQLARQAIATGLLSESVQREPLATERLDATLYRLSSPRSRADRTVCGREFARAGGPVPMASTSTPAVALPAEQRTADGWSYAELGDDLTPYRWSTTPTVRIRLRGTVAPGPHTLHLVGLRLPHPGETARLRVALAGTGGSPLFDAALGPGPFHLRLAFDLLDLTRPLTDPVLTVHHPTWSPAEAFGSTDSRRLGFQLLGAWVSAEPPD